MLKNVFVLALLLGILGVPSCVTPQPASPPSPAPPVQTAKTQVAAIGTAVQAQATGVQADAAAIDSASVDQKNQQQIKAVTDSLRGRAKSLSDQATVLLQQVAGELTDASVKITGYQAELDRSRQNESNALSQVASLKQQITAEQLQHAKEAAQLKTQIAAAQKERDQAKKDARHDTFVQATVWCVGLGITCLVLTLFLFHDVTFGIGGVSIFWGAAILLASWDQLLQNKYLLYGGGGTIIGLSAVGMILLWRSGYLTYKGLVGGAKLLREGKLAEGVAALRTDADFEKAWEVAAAEIPAAPSTTLPAAPSGA